MTDEAALRSVTSAISRRSRGTGSEGLIAVATHPDVDIVICASSGTAALEAVLAAIGARKTIALANKEVLVMAGALVTAAARARGSGHSSGRQRAQRHSSVPARPSARGDQADHPDGLGRTVPRDVGRGAGRRETGGCAAASDVAHGPQDHHRLGDVDEQGTGGDRSALALRPARPADRRRDSPAVDRAFDGGARSTVRSSRSSAART